MHLWPDELHSHITCFAFYILVGSLSLRSIATLRYVSETESRISRTQLCDASARGLLPHDTVPRELYSGFATTFASSS